MLSGHKAFEFVITTCILVNTVLMAMKHFSMSERYESTLDYFNYAFVIIFDIECLIKLIALGKYYFYSRWNLFDFLVVLASTIGLILLLFGIRIKLVTIATIIRAFKMTTIFKYIKASNNIKVLLDTMVYILPSLANIGGLIFLLLFIYAVLGINLFATVKFKEEINENTNFRSFGSAIFLLIRCATGEKWHLLMHELANSGSFKGQQCISD